MTAETPKTPIFPMVRNCPFDPAPQMTRMREYSAVARVSLWDGSSAWLVTRYADARAALSDPRLSSDATRKEYPHVSAGQAENRLNSPTFMTRDNPDHDIQRRMLTRDFTVKRIEAMRPKIQATLDRLIDDMLAGPRPADLVTAVGLPLPTILICELLGVPYSDRDMFHRTVSKLMLINISREEARAANTEINEYLRRLVDSKDASPGDDVISHLVIEQLRTGTLSRAQVADMAQLLLTAGHETSASMISLGTALLLQHPEQLAELRDTNDPALVANAVEEVLRYLSVTHSGRRRFALEDLTIGDQLIKAGDAILVAVETPNRDPAAFPDPDSLDIHRKARHHVAFGYGIHQCLGQPLARVELQVVYSTLYRRIPTLALAVPLESVPFKHEMAIYGVHALPVTW